ncbi:MAG: LysM peptidoglycan-binding domain-containing protein [bacterium]|nr:LysM peptidoglycan-binding domain-containing protein [bacterium]
MGLQGKVIKAYADKSVQELADAPVNALKGVSKKDAELLNNAFHVKTIRDLALLKYVLWAREINSLASNEQADMAAFKKEFKDKLIKKYESKTPAQLAKAPVYALQGFSEPDSRLMKEAFNIKTVKDLAELKFVQWAQEIVEESLYMKAPAEPLKSVLPEESKKPEEIKSGISSPKKSSGVKKIFLPLAAVALVCLFVYFLPTIKTIFNEDKGASAVNSLVEKKEPAKAVEKPAQDSYYRVKKKDTLVSISKNIYGSGSSWKDLYKANKESIKNPDIIYPGQKLKISR